MHWRSFFAGIIGNILEHYDTALFGLLAPFIAPLFFHHHDPLTALVLTYGMIPLGMLTRPLGSLCFGWVGDRFGRRQALCWSLSGMALVTVGMGSLPTSCEIGPLAPVFLAALRLCQSFFAAGETAGGAIYVLENTASSKQSIMSSVFDSSTIGGILIASSLVTFLSVYNGIEENWRYLFWAGGVTAIVGIFFRLTNESSPRIKINVVKEIYENRTAFLAIIFAAGFSYTTYSMAFTLMNGLIPLLTSLTKAEVMKINTALLCLDLFLLPFFGYLANRYGKEKIMFFGLLAALFGVIPLFSTLSPSSTLLHVAAIRLFIVLSGIAFAAPYHAWAMEQVPPRCRSTILCLGYTLGSQIIGTPTAAIGIWAYQQSGWIGAPVLYVLPVALGALWAVRRVPSPLSNISVKYIERI